MRYLPHMEIDPGEDSRHPWWRGSATLVNSSQSTEFEEAPVVREDVVKKVKTVPRHVYLVHLGVPRLPEPDEPLVEVRSVGPGHVERLVAVDVPPP